MIQHWQWWLGQKPRQTGSLAITLRSGDAPVDRQPGHRRDSANQPKDSPGAALPQPPLQPPFRGDPWTAAPTEPGLFLRRSGRDRIVAFRFSERPQSKAFTAIRE